MTLKFTSIDFMTNFDRQRLVMLFDGTVAFDQDYLLDCIIESEDISNETNK